MRAIDSSVLSWVKRALKLGAGGSMVTDLDDGQVSQVLELGRGSSREQTFGQGIFTAVLTNAMTTAAPADFQEVSVNPYAPQAASGVSGGNFPPYPELVPRGFDFYIHAASCLISNSTGFTCASLRLATPPANVAWSRINTDGVLAGGAASAAVTFWLANWTAAENAALGASTIVGVAGTGTELPMQRIATRVPRGSTLGFSMRLTTDSIITAHCVMICEVVKSGLAGADSY